MLDIIALKVRYIIYMNRNVLKIIAVVTMLVDHIGWQFFPDIIWFRVVGRIAFPIFAFFIAQGMFYTRSRKKYILNMLGIGVISQIPYMFLSYRMYNLNIMFTFILASLVIVLIEELNKKPNVWYSILLGVIFVVSVILSAFGILNYGFLGMILVLCFYFIKSKGWSFAVAGLLLVLITLKDCLKNGFSFNNAVQIFSLLSLVILLFYNGGKGKANLKYMFYIFYPAHLAVILIITLFI